MGAIMVKEEELLFHARGVRYTHPHANENRKKKSQTQLTFNCLIFFFFRHACVHVFHRLCALFDLLLLFHSPNLSCMCLEQSQQNGSHTATVDEHESIHGHPRSIHPSIRPGYQLTIGSTSTILVNAITLSWRIWEWVFISKEM